MKNSSDILRELQEFKKTWRVQNFKLTQEQQNRYDELISLRRAFVSHWKETDRVWVGPSLAGKPIEE